MIKSGQYAIYGGNEYELNGDMNGNDIIITTNRNYIDDSFVDDGGSGVYTKIVELSQLDEIYSITVYGIVNGEKLLVCSERDGYYFVETSDCEISDKLQLDRVDKYGYGGWIPSESIQIVEEKHYIKLKEE
jgi:hypothetical protein